MLKTRVWVWILGLLFVQVYVICVLHDFVVPEHAHSRYLLEIFLPGFKWLTPWRFALGLVESFLWGAYLALLCIPAINMFSLKHHRYKHPGHATRAAA